MEKDEYIVAEARCVSCNGKGTDPVGRSDPTCNACGGTGRWADMIARKAAHIARKEARTRETRLKRETIKEIAQAAALTAKFCRVRGVLATLNIDAATVMALVNEILEWRAGGDGSDPASSQRHLEEAPE